MSTTYGGSLRTDSGLVRYKAHFAARQKARRQMRHRFPNEWQAWLDAFRAEAETEGDKTPQWAIGKTQRRLAADHPEEFQEEIRKAKSERTDSVASS